MGIRNFEQFRQYILRKLGEPLEKVDVTREQFEDRFSEAIEYYQLFHYDGINREYMRFRIKASELSLTDTNEILKFKHGFIVKGVTSGATATVTTDHRKSGQKGSIVNTVSGDDNTIFSLNADGTRDDDATNLLLMIGIQGDFIAGEQVVQLRGGKERTSRIPDISDLNSTFTRDQKLGDPLYELVDTYYVAPQYQSGRVYPIHQRVSLGQKIYEAIRNNASTSPENNSQGEWRQLSPSEASVLQQRYIKGTVKTPTKAGEKFLVKNVIDTRYIDMPDDVFGVTNVLSVNQATASKNIFDLQYQLRLHDLYDLTSTGLIHYKNVMGYLSLLHLELNGWTIIRFNRRQSRLYLDINYDYDLLLGDFLIVEGYRALYPEVWNKVYDDPWLKEYTAALVKRQWGQNLKKFGQVALVGGVALDGQAMYDEAKQEAEELKQQLKAEEGVLEWFIG